MSDASKVRWGFISTAGIASKNFLAVTASKDGACVAVASRDIAKARSWAEERSTLSGASIKPYGSYDELLADASIQAVYIPLPTALHKEWVIKAAAAGKHVLCDKPVGIDAAEVRAMVNACRDAGVQFMDGVMFNHNPRLSYIERYIRDTDGGEAVIGKLRKVTIGFTFCSDDTFMANNIRVKKDLEPLGCIGDLAWYCVRFALFAFNYEHPLRVSCVCLEKTADGVPLTTLGTVYFPAGKVLTFDCGFSTAFRQWAEIAGTKGTVSLEDFTIAASADKCSFKVVTESEPVDDATRVKGKVDVVEVRQIHQEKRMFDTFNTLVKANRTATTNDFWPRLTLQTQLVCDALMRSIAAEGVLVDVEAPDR